jgi:hypothetical protein
MNTQIDITKNGTTTLATAGKYCDRNIDVNVDALADFVQGATAGEYVSDKVTSLKMAAFAHCKSLTKVSLPNCVSFASFRTFFACSEITELSLPSLTTIGDGTNTFGQMYKLKEISLPNLTSVSTFNAMFDNCFAVTRIELLQLGGVTIGSNAFKNCYALHTLVLGGNALNTLGNSNAFSGANASLKIYVPDNLVEEYRKNTTWSSMADKIKPISELEE